MRESKREHGDSAQMYLVLPRPAAHFKIGNHAIVVYHLAVKCKEDPTGKGSIHLYCAIEDSDAFFEKHLESYFSEGHTCSSDFGKAMEMTVHNKAVLPRPVAVEPPVIKSAFLRGGGQIHGNSNPHCRGFN